MLHQFQGNVLIKCYDLILVLRDRNRRTQAEEGQNERHSGLEFRVLIAEFPRVQQQLRDRPPRLGPASSAFQGFRPEAPYGIRGQHELIRLVGHIFRSLTIKEIRALRRNPTTYPKGQLSQRRVFG